MINSPTRLKFGLLKDFNFLISLDTVYPSPLAFWLLIASAVFIKPLCHIGQVLASGCMIFKL